MKTSIIPHKNILIARLLPWWLILAAPLLVQAQFTFTTNNGAITIISYDDTNAVVEIPAMTNGYPVTSISGYAFNGRSSMTSVSIPFGITNIGDMAFNFCASLGSVTIPESVTTIGSSSFGNCTSLTGVVIPQSVTSLGSTPFFSCDNLATIIVDTNNPAYASVEGVLFNRDLTTLLECPAGKSGGFTIPASVTNIQPLAFYSCQNLTGVTIPDLVD